MRQSHAAQHVRRLGELDIVRADDLDAVAPWVEKIEKGPGKRLNPRVGHRFCGALRILAPKLTQKLNLIGVRAGLRCLASCKRLLIQLNRRR